MNLTDCYRLLELTAPASLADVKASYRRLARRYHPDVNPGDRQAQEKFILVTEAYKRLARTVPQTVLQTVPPSAPQPIHSPPPAPNPVSPPSASPPPKVKVSVSHREQGRETTPRTTPSHFEQQLKQVSYKQLQELLKYQRFPRAIALVEGLAQRLPNDPEVIQWQAIAYQCWGRHLIGQRQLDKARLYLKKALHTDPHNRTLWAEVERDFRKLEKIY